MTRVKTAANLFRSGKSPQIVASCSPSLHGNDSLHTAESVWETNFEVQESKDYS
jgi:hypothetical protein